MPEANASSAGFTQLLRALNYDMVKEAPQVPIESKAAATVAGPAIGGPMTQMLRTLGEPAAERHAVEKPMPPVSSSQVTSFLPQSAPVVPAAPPSALPAAGSFTQLFKQLEAEPSLEMEPEKPTTTTAPSFTQMFESPTAVTVAVERVEPVPASLGSFTQMFQALGSSEIDAVPPAVAQTTAGAERAPTRTPEHVVAPLEARVPVAAPVSSPGSFTQMFQALDAPAVAPQTVKPVEIRAESKTPVNSPGSFTQIFQALETPAVEESRYVPPPAREVPQQAPVSAPGSFTQMFRTLGEESQGTKQPEAAPGSFTQMFDSPPVSPVPPPPSSYERPFAASTPGREESGASQMFATYLEPQPRSAERGSGFSPEAALAGKAPASTPSGVGLTQLLRALDGPTPAARPYVAPSSSPPVAQAPQPGSFTGVYGELGSPATAMPVPVAPVAAAQPPTAEPSAFTREINASAMREMSLRGGGEVAAAQPNPAAAPAGGGAGFAIPGGLPAMPHASFGAPAAPQASVAGPGGAHAAVSAAGGGQASFAAPKLPSIPQVKTPEMPKAGSAPAGMQKYVPLLLILVIFLLLAILVAVVVLMKK